MIRRLPLLLAAIGLAASLAHARPAEAAAKITVIAAGTIDFIFDPTGALTRGVSDDLAGTEVTMTLVFTETPFSIIEAGPPEAFASFTVFSVRFAFANGPVTSFSSDDNPFAFYALTETVGVAANIELDVGGGAALTADLAYNDPSFGPATIFDEAIFSAAPTGGWTFGGALSGGDDSIWEFVATPTAITIAVDREVAVPAPAAAGLFAVGLLGLALVRRRA